MLSHEEFIRSQQDCADMLGMTLEEYENFCNNITVCTESDYNNINDNVNEKREYSILDKLGINASNLNIKGL